MSEKEIISVAQLNYYVKALIDRTSYFGDLWVRGEISNFTNHYKSGHFYLTLKDDKSLIKAVMFRGSASKLPFLPENGMKVLVHGRVAVFERDGQYQLYLDDMLPDGLGSLHIAFEQLKAKLEIQGLFQEKHKLQIPEAPRTVGVITSPTGAAVRDIIHVIGRRFPLANILLYPVLVQGDGAPGQLCAALDYFEKSRSADVLIIGRGGGSLEELWAFNSEDLARKLYDMTVPTISAVGHETDFTICDFVADLRAPTPSAAAEMSVPNREDILSRIKTDSARMIYSINQRLQLRQSSLVSLTHRLNQKSPDRILDDKRMHCDYLMQHITAIAALHLEKARNRFSEMAGVLDAISPLRTMQRGYSIALSDGKAINRVADVAVGQNLTLRMTDGQLETQITAIGAKQHG